MKIIDLTYTIHEDMQVYPGTEKPSLKEANTLEKDGFREVKINMYSHTGTHIDAPFHMLKEGKTLDEFSIDKFIGKACVLDFSNYNKEIIELNDLLAYEDKISQCDFIIIKTGWEKYWGTDEYYNNFKSISTECANYLAKCKLKGIGVDAISIDSMDSEDFSVHLTLLASETIIIENLTNLNEIESEYFTLSVLPLKTKNADGSPVRATAICI